MSLLRSWRERSQKVEGYPSQQGLQEAELGPSCVVLRVNASYHALRTSASSRPAPGGLVSALVLLMGSWGSFVLM